MLKETARLIAIVGLWTAAGAMLIGGTYLHSPVWMHWGLFVGITAAVMNAWLIAECAVHKDRVHINELVDAVVDQLDTDREDASVHRL